jgi:hypothetical protein
LGHYHTALNNHNPAPLHLKTALIETLPKLLLPRFCGMFCSGKLTQFGQNYLQSCFIKNHADSIAFYFMAMENGGTFSSPPKVD